jgi:hypothetical protein
MRRALTRTRAPILRSLSLIVPQVAWANCGKRPFAPALPSEVTMKRGLASPLVHSALATELSPNLGDGGAGQAAAIAGWRVALAATSSPSANFTPRISFGNWA